MIFAPMKNHMKRRTQFALGSEIMSKKQIAAPLRGRYGIHGHRNGRRRLGWYFRSSTTLTLTKPKAISVPMLTNSTSTDRGINAAVRETHKPVKIVTLWGVLNTGCTAVKNSRGRSPSKHKMNTC